MNGLRRCGTYILWNTMRPLKKNEITSSATTWMQLEILILSEVSQKKKDKYHIKWSKPEKKKTNITYVDSKIRHKWTYLQSRNRLTDIQARLVVAKGEVGVCGMDWGFGVSTCKLLHLEWISNEVLLYSTGNYIQSLGTDHDGRLYKERNALQMYDWVTLLYSRKLHNIVNQL